ncbi:response regulator [Cellulophaga tyrosinoxydans]|uniref:response regulator n=1 Tax=Cellulophaga tyrosinoxydans TaxID=504486 RepID=UPI00373FDF5B
MSELLELEGYTALTATNGYTGLEKIKLQLPDLIICDLRMPEMDGFTLIKTIGRRFKV